MKSSLLVLCCFISLPLLAQNNQPSSQFVQSAVNGVPNYINPNLADINRLQQRVAENTLINGLNETEIYFLEVNFYVTLRNMMERNPDAVLRKMAMSTNELADLYIVLKEIENESSDRSMERSRKMCSYWKRLSGPYDAMTKADMALIHYDELRLSKFEMGARISDRLFRVEQELNSEIKENLEIQFLNYKAGLTSFSVSSWTEVIRSSAVGMAAQLEFTCGERQ